MSADIRIRDVMPLKATISYWVGMLILGILASFGGALGFTSVMFTVAFSFQYWSVFAVKATRLEDRLGAGGAGVSTQPLRSNDTRADGPVN